LLLYLLQRGFIFYIRRLQNNRLACLTLLGFGTVFSRASKSCFAKFVRHGSIFQTIL
jgi:hypothetical protein